jgi:cell wall assembly regulator SMI1
MPKATRSQTREVEVGGVRLVVTLDDKGVSFQAADESGPPLTLSWTAALCGTNAGEPSAADVARVLKGLEGKGGQTNSSGLPAVLARMEAWLKQKRRRFYKGLRTSATEEELAALGSALGKPVPAGLADWLRWHNGQDEEVIGAFVESFHLMGTAEIIEALSRLKKQRRWKAGWVPILDDDQDDHVVVDTSRAELPVCEWWQGSSDVPEVAPSLEAWLTGLVSDFEAGRYYEEPERGEFRRRDSGA